MRPKDIDTQAAIFIAAVRADAFEEVLDVLDDWPEARKAVERIARRPRKKTEAEHKSNILGALNKHSGRTFLQIYGHHEVWLTKPVLNVYLRQLITVYSRGSNRAKRYYLRAPEAE